VVELSSSEDEEARPAHQGLDLSSFIPLQANQEPASFDPNEPIMILSSDEEEEMLQTVTPTNYAPALSAMRMQLNTLAQRKPVQEPEDSSSEDDLIVVKTERAPRTTSSWSRLNTAPLTQLRRNRSQSQ